MTELWEDPNFSDRQFNIDNRYSTGGRGWKGESRRPPLHHSGGQTKSGRTRRQCMNRSGAGAQNGWRPDPNKQREQPAKAVAIADINRLQQRFNTR